MTGKERERLGLKRLKTTSLSLWCFSITTAVFLSLQSAAAHNNLSSSEKATLLISPIMLLLDEAGGNIDLCNSFNGNSSLPDLGENTPSGHTDPGKLTEHIAIFEFVDYSKATHAAIASGRWNDPGTWYHGRIPTSCANVVIPDGITVQFDSVIETRINTVRVDGVLAFSTATSSKIIVDTLVVDPRGTLQIGSKSQPVQANITAEIIIADNGDINVQEDPMLLSRGIVSHGTTQIHGSYKKTHIKVSADPKVGDTLLRLAESPVGWRVGDKLVAAGTRYFGWKWDNDIRDVRYFGTQDEVRYIQAISGTTVTLDQALEYDHSSPRSDLKTSIANFTRNVSIRTENSGSVATHQRGHVMFMHSDKVDVRYAEFDELGRTDKSVASFEVADVASIQSDSNVRGRYSFHFHRTGTDNLRNPAIAAGNTVFGSPGWGYTHHDSHALFHDNASFNTFGAGFVAETGNETGIWSNNIAIKAEGNRAFNPKNGNQPTEFDMGRTGDGFWFQGRLVRSIDNVAASVNHGYVYLHRGSGMFNFPPDRFMLPEALGLGRDATPDDAPIRNFDGNESFASTVGLYVVKANPQQEHDIITVLSDFTAWEVRAGAAIEYTAHYLLDDFDLIGARPGDFFNPAFAVEFGRNTSDMIARDVRMKDFPQGIILSKEHTSPSNEGKDQFVVIDAQYTNVTTQLVDYDSTVDVVINSSALTPQQFQIEVDNNAGRYEYLSPSTDASNPNSRVLYTGTKTDSIGESPLPSGTDVYGIFNQDMIANVRVNGYYQDVSSGDTYTIVENYFSDRATGEIHKYGFKTYLGPDVVNVLGNRFHAWRDAVDNGSININSQAPVGVDDTANAAVEQDVNIQLVSNDTDPENDSLSIDGIVQPRDGLVFKNNDGMSVTYRSNIGFTGVDTFYYWVTDGNGNYDKASVRVTVTN